MPFYIDEKSFNVESDKKENKWDIRPACCYKQNKRNQKFWSQERCDSAGDVSGCQKFWVGKLWGPARNIRGETQKFWVVFRQWTTSQKFCITLKQWVNPRNSVYCQHVKIRNSECVKTASGNIRSSVCLTCRENSEVLWCVRTVSES